MSGFTAGGAVLPLGFHSAEVQPRDCFAGINNIEACAKLVLTANHAGNSRKLSSLWTLINVDRNNGEINTPAQSGAVVRDVFAYWTHLGFVDTSEHYANAIRAHSVAAEQGMAAESARREYLRLLLNFFMHQSFPRPAVVVMGPTNATEAQRDGRVIIVRQPGSAGDRRLVDIHLRGEGSFGKVHRATFLGPDDHVPGFVCPRIEAVKSIDITKMGRALAPADIPELEARLKREVANQLLVRHTGIVTLFDFSSVQPLCGRPPPGTEGELIRYSGARLLLNMELCPGRELYDEIVDKTFASPEGADCLRVALSITGRALLYLHFASIVHRDIKPENMGYFFDHSRPGDRIHDKIVCKLFDFGLSKQIGTTPSQMGVTAGMGTPHFKAPEVGAPPFLHDFKADVYSFGITLAVGFGMEIPCVNPDTHEIDLDLCRRIMNGRDVYMDDRVQYANTAPSFPMHVHTWQHLSPELRDLIHGSTRRNPAERYSMQQVMQHPFWGDVVVGDAELAQLALEGATAKQRMDRAAPIQDLF
jgi:serine/threonine protein kinase